MRASRVRASLRLMIGAGIFVAGVGGAFSVGMNVAFWKATCDGLARQKPAAPIHGVVRWTQLEPGNGPAFTAHLRALGCPEETIATLLGASRPANAEPGTNAPPFVGSATVPQIPIPNSEAGVIPPSPPAPPSPLSPTSNFGVRAGGGAINGVPRGGSSAGTNPGTTFSSARGGKASRLVGPVATARNLTSMALASADPATSASPVAAASAAEGAGNEAVIVAPEGDIVIPAAFVSSHSDAKLSAQQKGQLAKVQEDFYQAIGGNARDPSSPGDLRTWREAQWLADQQYRAIFGYQAFLEKQIQANLDAGKSSAGQ